MTSAYIVLFAFATLFLAQGYAQDSSGDEMQATLENTANEFANRVKDTSNNFINDVERQSSDAMSLIQSSVDDNLRDFGAQVSKLEAEGANITGCSYVIRDLGTNLARRPAECITAKVAEARDIVESFRDVVEKSTSAVDNARIGLTVCEGRIACAGEVAGKAMIIISLQSSRVAALVSRAGVLAGTSQFSVLGCITAALSDSPSLVTQAGDQLAACIADSIDDTPPTTPPPADVDTSPSTDSLQ